MLFQNFKCKPKKARAMSDQNISNAARSISWAMFLNITVSPIIQELVIEISIFIKHHIITVLVNFFHKFNF